MEYLLDKIGSNLYAIATLLFIYGVSRKNMGISSQQQEHYHRLLLATVLLLVCDAVSRAAFSASVFWLRRLSMLAVFLLYYGITWLGCLYMGGNIAGGQKKLRFWRWLIGALCLFESGMVLFSQQTGWFYYFDRYHVYHHGPYFTEYMLLALLGALILEIMLIVHRRQIDVHNFYSLLFFMLPPIVLAALMTVFGGRSFVAEGIAFSLLIIFINIQGRNLEMDYLTQVYNRRQLDWKLAEKISSASKHPFAAVMVDLDDFKQVNDSFGHDVGDEALQAAAEIIRSCVRKKDFIARYGGDEFCILLEDISEEHLADEIILRIERRLVQFNTSGDHPYQLRFSMGCSLYDPESGMDARQFQQRIDALMYRQKGTQGAH